MNSKSFLPYSLAIIIGMTLWFAVSFVSGRKEAWDAPQYWTIAFPLLLISAAALGYAFPEKPWRWALALFLSQMPAMMIRSGEVGNLWPLGLIMLTIYSLPAIACAASGSWLRKKFACHKNKP
jgi:hypothetical protein